MWFSVATIVLVSLVLLSNYKAVPFVFFVRLAFRIIPNLHRNTCSLDDGRARSVYESVCQTSICALNELDHNLHKSNSTFFVDMDISRAELLVRLFSPALLRRDSHNVLTALAAQGHKGPFGVVLGAVHVDFSREIKLGQMYRTESRVVGWDRKWLVIETNFWRPRGDHDKVASGHTDGGKIVLARGVSKFVFKKGRFTVSPAIMFEAAGLRVDEESVGEKDTNFAISGEQVSNVEKKTLLDREATWRKYETWLNFSNTVL